MSDAEEPAHPSESQRPGDMVQKDWLFSADIRMASRYAAAVVLVLVGSVLAQADTFRLLADDRQAIQARVDLIQQAQREIVMVHYAMDQGRVSASLLAVLQEAAKRGVRVRIIVDGLISRIPTELDEVLESQGIQLHSYHPPRVTHPLWLNRRIHVKLLVIDGCQMIVGSRNLQDKHFGLSDNNFVDCDAYLRGVSARHARRYFDWLWQTADVQPLRRFDSSAHRILDARPFDDDPWTTAWRKVQNPRDVQQLLTRSLAVLVQCHGIRLHTQNDWSAGQPGDISAAVLHDRSPSKHRHAMEKAILETVNNARRTVLIVTPYPAMTHPMQDAVLDAQRRGVQVTLVTNSLGSTDKVATYAAYQNLKGRLLQAGVRLWEYDGPETLHAKAMVIDATTAMIGSYNFDPRSAYSNLEIAVIIHDPRAVVELQQAVMQHMANSRQVTPATRALPLQKWLPAGDETNRNVSAARRAKMLLHRLTMPAFRWLL